MQKNSVLSLVTVYRLPGPYTDFLKECADFLSDLLVNVNIRKLKDNQNNPRFLFSIVIRLTNKQMSPDHNIPSQFNSNDFR